MAMHWKSYLSLAALLCLWQAAVVWGLLDAAIFPAPTAILSAGWELGVQGLPRGSLLHSHLLYSLLRVLCGFVLAVLVGVPLGICMGWSRRVRSIISPLVELVRPVPPLAWIPLAILWFGIGLQSATFIIFLGCFFPIVLNTLSGVLSVDRQLVEAAQLLGARPRTIFLSVYIPGATPSIYTGFRIGLGIGWMTLVAAEFTGVKSGFGLGYMIMTARDIQRPDLVLAGMAAIGITGLILDWGLRLLEHRALRWRRGEA